MDGATGLTYMQQRYYDQSIGRFLSVDPVSADGNSGVHFNRYKYASNNPYRFIDPDGRMDREFRQELRQMRRFQAEEHEENLEKLSMVLTSRFSAMAYSVDGLELGGKDFSVSDIYIGLFGGATKSVGATQNVTKLGYSEIRSLLDESGKITHRSRESVALRKLTSHAQGKARSGDFKEARGGIAKKNAYVQSVIFEILTNKNMVKTPLSGGGFEYRVGRDGRGVRYNADGSFNTFLDSRRRGK
jgi:RHS repeat-associated protein